MELILSKGQLIDGFSTNLWPMHIVLEYQIYCLNLKSVSPIPVVHQNKLVNKIKRTG